MSKEYKTVHQLWDDASGASSGADRMTGYDGDVIRLSVAKELIEEAYNQGVKQVALFLDNRQDTCNCADDVRQLLLGL